MIAERQTFLGHAARQALPYDAEVEYLESTGTQYIDTGTVPTGHTRWAADAMFMSVANYSAPAVLGLWCNPVAKFSIAAPVVSSASPHGPYRVATGTHNMVDIPGSTDNPYRRHMFCVSDEPPLANKSGWGFVDGNDVIVPTSDPAVVPDGIHVHLFGRVRMNSNMTEPVVDASSIRLYSACLYESEVLVHRYIPVRRGSEGFLYDQITGETLHNAGTGSFICGPDIEGFDLVFPASLRPNQTGYLGFRSGDADLWTPESWLLPIDKFGYYEQRFRFDASKEFVITGVGANDGDTVAVYLQGGGVPYYNQTPVSISPEVGSAVTVQGLFGTTYDSCLVAGTMVLMADGSWRRIEDVGYDDTLLTWDREAGRTVAVRPSWIMRPYEATHWYECRFASGRTLCTTGAPFDPGHRVYSLDTGRYEYERDAIGHRVLSVTKSGGIGAETRYEPGEDVLESVACIPHRCTACNIITEGRFSLIAEGVLTSCRLSNPGMSEDEIAAYWARLERSRKPREA